MVDVLAIVQVLVNIRADADSAGMSRFLPVDLWIRLCEAKADEARREALLTISFMRFPTSRKLATSSAATS